MLKYIITIVLFIVVVFIIKVFFPLWRFYNLSTNIIDTYEMIVALLNKASEQKIENVTSKPIVLTYDKYKVRYNNLNQAYEVLAKYCEKALNYAERIKKFMPDSKELEQEMWRITNIYNEIRSELWKNKTV